MSERELMHAIQRHATRLGHRLFRNNVGLFSTMDGRKVQTGLCKGSSDLIGWTKDGRFFAVEVKTATGRVRPEQQSFIDAVNAAGGVGIIARKEEDLNAV